MNLHEETLKLMRRSEINVSEACRECGLTTRWYYMLKNGEIKNPGYERLQRLHDFLRREHAA